MGRVSQLPLVTPSLEVPPQRTPFDKEKAKRSEAYRMMDHETPGKKKPGRKRCENTSSNIRRCALEMVEERGFRETTIEGVAARAGVGKTTIYRWWPNKSTLVIDAFLRLRQRELKYVYSGDWHSDLLDLAGRYVSFANGRSGKTMAALIGWAQSDPELSQAFLRTWSDVRMIEACEFLQRAVEDGHLDPDLDKGVFLDAFFGPMYIRLMVGHRPLTQEYAHAHVANILRMFPASRVRENSGNPAKLAAQS